MRWRAKTFFKPAICGIERTPKGIILYCSSDTVAQILGKDYFVAMPLLDPLYDEDILSEQPRASVGRQEWKGLAQIRDQNHYIEGNAIKLEMGMPQAIAHLKKAIDLIHNPVADAPDIPSLFPEVPGVLEVPDEARCAPTTKSIRCGVRATVR